MSKSLKKDFRREVKKSLSRFISILLIVVLGVAFYSGIRSAMPAMQMSADYVYDKQNLMDVRVIGTLGLTKDDLETIKNVEGVEDAEGSFATDFLCLANSEEIVTKAIAMPDRINDIKVLEGRYPEKYNECLVSKEFLEESGLEVGGYVTLSTGTEESVFDTLAAETFTIVGVCSSSFFLNGDMGTSSIGDGVVDGYAVIPKEAFVTDVFTSINVTVANAKELDCFESDYQELIDKVIKEIEEVSGRQRDIRYSEVRSQSNDMISKARNEYNASKAKAEEELGEANQKLRDNEEVINENIKMLEEKKATLQNAETQLPVMKNEIAKREQQVIDGEAELKRVKKELEEGKAQVELAKQQLEDKKNDPTVPPEEIQQDEEYLRVAIMSYQLIEQQVEQKEKDLIAGKKQLESAKQTVKDIESVTAGSGDAIAKAEKELEEAKLQLQKGKEQYETARQDMIDELADAAEKLNEKENEINNMEIPVWYVLDRTSVESYASYLNDSESIGAIGTVFPIIFFLVAALVSLTTMTRMVAEQRTQIGTLKALGYSKTSIVSKYIMYALLASLIGSVIGIFLGEYTIPPIIVKAYKMLYYNLEGSVVMLNLRYGLTAAALAVLCTTLAAFAACYKELRSAPAQLMRPEAPKVGKKILIERISFIWDRLNFSQKSAMRNLFRYKKRFFMTLFGVGGCMALLLVGLGVRDSVSAMANNQFGKVFTYDANVSVDSTLSRAKRRAMLSEISDIPDVESYLQANRTMVYSASEEDKDFENEKNAYLIVPRNTDDFKKYVTLKERTGLLSTLSLSDEGVIITEKYASLLDVAVGDSIFIKLSQSDAYPKEVKVAGITENYIFNYIYMTPKLYQTIYQKAPELNMLMIKNADSADDNEISERLLQIGGINSVTMNSEQLETVNNTINKLYFVIFIMIIAAGVLAFVVLYNLNNINISERRRELATLKLLGFYDTELASYVYRENIILTILGTVLGIFLGIFLHKFVMITVETDVFMFGRELNWYSYVIGSVLTILFSVLVNIVMYFKLKKIDMVESLKSVE